jgi:hypothetical protein
MEEQNNKNLILAMVLSAAVMIVWFVLFPPPEPPVEVAAPTSGQTVTDGAPAGVRSRCSCHRCGTAASPMRCRRRPA